MATRSSPSSSVQRLHQAGSSFTTSSRARIDRLLAEMTDAGRTLTERLVATAQRPLGGPAHAEAVASEPAASKRKQRASSTSKKSAGATSAKDGAPKKAKSAARKAAATGDAHGKKHQKKRPAVPVADQPRP